MIFGATLLAYSNPNPDPDPDRDPNPNPDPDPNLEQSIKLFEMIFGATHFAVVEERDGEIEVE